MSKLKISCFTLACLFSASGASALTIDYAYVGSHSISQAMYQAIGAQTWMFTHASVGGNMINGMDTLHTSQPATYRLDPQAALLLSPPSTATPGTIYEINRGNPGWQNKFTEFQQAVASGWGNKVGFVMDKLCYIDQNANAATYLTMMEQLDSLYSATFVYTTMPLMTGSDADNILRNLYNNTVRDYAAAHNKLLFDIADLEAHDANGNEITFGTGYQALSDGWSNDGGHLNSLGQEMIAKAWYSLADNQAEGSNAVPEPGTLLLFGLGLTALVRRFTSGGLSL